MRILGLKNAVYNEQGWRYLLFYDIDGDTIQLQRVQETVRHESGLSYVLYSTKHGYHFVGLNPLTAGTWGSMFDALQTRSPQYYSGGTIRLSRKPDEEQQIVEYNDAGNAIERLWNLYAHRFGISYRPAAFNEGRYRLVYETYKTKKE